MRIMTKFALLLSVWASLALVTATASGSDPVGDLPETSLPADNLIGFVYPQRALDIVPEIGGLVESIDVELGQRVSEGSVLAQLTTRWIRHDLDIALTDLASAEAEISKAVLKRDLADGRFQRRQEAPETWTGEELASTRFEAEAAAVDVTLAEARLARNRAQVDLLTDRLEQTKIRAPFAGVICGRFVEPGDLVSMTSPLVRLITDDILYVRFGVPENRIHQFAMGMTLAVRFPSLDCTAEMSVTRLAPEIDPATGMALAEGPLTVPDAMRGRILSGMSARVIPRR